MDEILALSDFDSSDLLLVLGLLLFALDGVAMPPLNALRAFEAAARHGSFASAAAELHVTAAAISHRIKDLERHLDNALFIRQPRGVLLTEAGRRYHEQVAAALQLIERATAQIDVNSVAGPLHVSTPRSFADAWLVPRLAGLRDAIPGLAFSLSADSALADLRDGQADVALRFGQGQYPGLHSEYLCSDAVTIVAPTALVQGNARAAAADLIQREVLLDDSTVLAAEPWSRWQPWLRECGVQEAGQLRHMAFSDSGLVTRAAAAGAGLAIGRLSIAYASLEARELSTLLPWRITEFAYYLVYRDADHVNPRVVAFRDWLCAEISQYVAHCESRFGVLLQGPSSTA